MFRIKLSLGCRSDICSDGGCRYMMTGLTKQDTGLYRFTDGTNLDFLPTPFIQRNFNYECHLLTKDSLYDHPCESTSSFICSKPGTNWALNKNFGVLKSMEKYNIFYLKIFLQKNFFSVMLQLFG